MNYTQEPWKVLAKMIAKDFNLMEDAVQNQINVWIEQRGLQGINPESVPIIFELLDKYLNVDGETFAQKNLYKQELRIYLTKAKEK